MKKQTYRVILIAKEFTSIDVEATSSDEAGEKARERWDAGDSGNYLGDDTDIIVLKTQGSK